MSNGRVASKDLTSRECSWTSRCSESPTLHTSCDWSNRTEKENSVCKTKIRFDFFGSTPTRPGRNLTRTFPKTEPKFGLQNLPVVEVVPYVIKTAMEHLVCHEARSLRYAIIQAASISTSYARSRSIHARLFATRLERNDRKFALVSIFSERKGLSALNGTDLANFKIGFGRGLAYTCP